MLGITMLPLARTSDRVSAPGSVIQPVKSGPSKAASLVASAGWTGDSGCEAYSDCMRGIEPRKIRYRRPRVFIR